MTVWQEYLFSCFKKQEYIPIPCTGSLHNMWRHATWDEFVRDTIECNGTQMATLLSMVYKPKTVVEFGLDAGFTTLQFCKLNPEAQVYGVDLNSWNQNTNLPICFHALMNKVNNLTLILGKPSWEFKLPGKVDLCFIDACHTGDAPWKDTQRAWDNRNINSNWCIAWDDYHENNPDVFSAVNKFVRLVQMELHQVGSWFYIGSLPHEHLREFGCTT